MFRIDDPSNSATLPTPEAAATEGYWTEGDPVLNIPATLERASWFNMVQEELRNIVVAAAITPSKTVYNQVLTAIKRLCASSAWVTKTANYAAVAGDRIMANTTGGAFTVTLPAGTAGQPPIEIADYNGAFAAHNLTVSGTVNGSSGATMSTNWQKLKFDYIDATVGYRAY